MRWIATFLGRAALGLAAALPGASTHAATIDWKVPVVISSPVASGPSTLTLVGVAVVGLLALHRRAR